jgi:hypothetical protein
MKYSLLMVLPFAIVTSHLCAQEFEITFKSDGEKIAVIDLTITSETATARTGDVIERFDLKQLRWQHDESKEWVTLSQSEAWAKQSKEKSSNNVDSIPDKVRPFVRWSLEPTFKTTATDTTLTLISGQVDYKIVAQKTDGDLTNYFRYAKLNAYKKAMTERKLPPFAELAVIEELERRKMMPTSMEIRIPGIAGAPMIQVLMAAKAK